MKMKMVPKIGSYIIINGGRIGKIVDCPCSRCDAHGMGGRGELIAIITLPNQIWNYPADSMEQDNNVVFRNPGPCGLFGQWPVHVLNPILKEISNEEIDMISIVNSYPNILVRPPKRSDRN